MENIKKYISAGGTTLEIGDLYGGEECITTMEETGRMLRIWTGAGYYDLNLQAGDWLQAVDGSAKLVKSKYDKQDE